MSAPTVRPPARPAPRPERPPSRTDPRIAARRIEVKRSEGRKRLRRLVLVAVVLVLVGAAGAATRTPLLDVDQVRIAGADRVPVDEIAAVVTAAGGGRGEPLATVDTAAIERALEDVPGIAAASVQRNWPATVVVDVIERSPVASVTTPAGVAVVAADGVVLDVLPAAPVWAVVLEGVDVDAETGAVLDAPELLEVAAAMPSSLAAEVDAVAVARDELQLRLHEPSGAVARLGSTDDLPDKLVAVATALEQVDLQCLATIDVRVPSAPAVTRIAGCLP